jgi:hypothetical protein
LPIDENADLFFSEHLVNRKRRIEISIEDNETEKRRRFEWECKIHDISYLRHEHEKQRSKTALLLEELQKRNEIERKKRVLMALCHVIMFIKFLCNLGRIGEAAHSIERARKA